MKSGSFGVLVTTLALVVGGVGCVAQGEGQDTEASESEINANANANAKKPTLLALGDSMAFAWDPNVPTNNDGRVIASRYRGYPDVIGERLGLRLDNASCPGETSGGFVSHDGEDNGCRDNRAKYALHADWQGAETQLDYVVSYLEKSIAAGKPPELITMSLGGNDLLLVKQGCTQWSLIGAACKLVRLPFVEHGFGENMEKILRTIGATGYRGTVVLLTTYALDYNDKIASFALGRLNGELRESVDHVVERDRLPMKIRIADGYAAFKGYADAHNGKTCETGLLIKNNGNGADGDCDIHPSAAGHKVLAEAIIAAAK